MVGIDASFKRNMHNYAPFVNRYDCIRFHIISVKTDLFLLKKESQPNKKLCLHSVSLPLSTAYFQIFSFLIQDVLQVTNIELIAYSQWLNGVCKVAPKKLRRSQNCPMIRAWVALSIRFFHNSYSCINLCESIFTLCDEGIHYGTNNPRWSII